MCVCICVYLHICVYIQVYMYVYFGGGGHVFDHVFLAGLELTETFLLCLFSDGITWMCHHLPAACFFEVRSCYVVRVGLEFIYSSCRILLSAKIAGVYPGLGYSFLFMFVWTKYGTYFPNLFSVQSLYFYARNVQSLLN